MMARSPLCTRFAAIGIVIGVFVFPAAYAQAQARPNCEEIRITGRPAFDLYLKCVVAQLPPLDPKRREWFGEHYDPKKYYECRKDLDFADMGCEKYRLVRRPEPEYWPYEGKVPPVKWPDPPAQSVYRKGMTAKQYFDALCKAEAGEFIYKSVENVEGIYQIRPRNRASDHELRDRYVMEDPYNYSEAEASRAQFQYVGKGLYKFYESPSVNAIFKTSTDEKYYDSTFFLEPPAGARLSRFTAQPNLDKKLWGGVKKEFDHTPQSRYGYTWRGIKRPQDRELGVVGGELAVIDLSNNEILGLRRGFAYSGYVRNVPSGFQWGIATMCPAQPHMTGGDLAPKFVQRVLKPALQGDSGASK